MKITNKIINIRNTFAFDATMHSIAEYLSTKLNPSSGQFLQTLSKKGVTAKLYETRGSILTATQPIKQYRYLLSIVQLIYHTCYRIMFETA
jgi:hypothetical protein